MTEARNENKLFALICLVLALGTAVLYWPITQHPFILYDDEQYVTANPHITSGLNWTNTVWAFKSGEAANWHPLTWLSHQADCSLFGLNAGAHHFVNLLFHVTNSLLLFVFLRGATGALWRSAVVAALFAWHPLHVESVAWASERKDMLSTFFWLLTLMAYVRYAQGRSRVESRESSAEGAKSFLSPQPSTLNYFAALLFFTLGLMSKPMVVTLPFVLLLLDFWPLKRIAECGVRSAEPALNPQLSTLNHLLLEKIPFFILAAAGSAVTYLVQSGGGAVWATPLTERLANAALAYARYVAKFFWPGDLAIVYSHPRHWPLALALAAMLVLVVWTMLCVRQWRTRPFLATGWFWFLGTLVPTIGLVQVGAQAMADRYTYIPSIGFFIVIVWGTTELFSTRPRGQLILSLLGTVALLGCAVTTAIQITYWRDNVSLFLHAIAVSPDNYVAANCLGKAFEKNGDNARALVLYREAVRLEPRYPQSQFNLALTLLGFGQTAKALTHLQAAAALEPRNPDIQFDLGIYFARNGSWPDAANCFSNSLAVRPGYAPAQCSYASALANLGQFPAALPHYRAALQLQPGYAAATNGLNHLLTDHPELR
jgi:tetratricopeptide (TPR) repeat protein